jgi:hypothetical protein
MSMKFASGAAAAMLVSVVSFNLTDNCAGTD